MLKKTLRKLSNIKKRVEKIYEDYLFQKYTKRALIPFDENWFKGKRVAVIGGADSAFKEKLGSYIDGFDVVVRINKGVEVIDKHSEYIGKRTDVLFHCFFDGPSERGGSPITLELWNSNDVKRIIFSHNILFPEYGFHLKKSIQQNKGNIRLSQLSLNEINSCFAKIEPYHPTTGLIAINTLFNAQPKELYITGITFFKTCHNQDYRKNDLDYWNKTFKEKGSRHNPEAEYRYVKSLYNAHPEIIKPDKTLEKIFKTN